MVHCVENPPSASSVDYSSTRLMNHAILMLRYAADAVVMLIALYTTCVVWHCGQVTDIRRDSVSG